MKLSIFQKYLRSKGISCAAFINNSARKKDWAIEYFTQIDDLEYGALIITQKSWYLLCSGFEYDRFKKNKKIPVKKCESIIDYISKHLKGVIGLNYQSLDNHTLLKIKKKLKAKRVDVSSQLLELRKTKTSSELKHIKKAAQIGDTIINSCFRRFKQFKTEQEVSTYLKKKCVEHGVTFSFPAIIASGKHAAICHHVPTKKLYKGFCVIDFGVKYKGYCSDMTRTIYLGKPSKKEKELYNLLLNVQKQGTKMLKPRTTFMDIDNTLRKQLGKYKKYFIHSFGHSLGMDVHDPLPHSSKKTVFENNMVFTMEPGIYIPNKLGMRIEDDVVIRKKPMVLTKTSKSLLCITS